MRSTYNTLALNTINLLRVESLGALTNHTFMCVCVCIHIDIVYMCMCVCVYIKLGGVMDMLIYKTVVTISLCKCQPKHHIVNQIHTYYTFMFTSELKGKKGSSFIHCFPTFVSLYPFPIRPYHIIMILKHRSASGNSHRLQFNCKIRGDMPYPSAAFL